jgi:hypothetical protein
MTLETNEMPPPLPVTLRDCRTRLFAVLRSAEFSTTDAEHITTLRGGITELIADLDTALHPEPDYHAAQRLVRFPRKVRSTHASNPRNGAG